MRSLISGLAAVLVLWGGVASAADAPACFARSVELIDQTLNPPEGGDAAFFTRVGGGPPAGMAIFANSPSMFQLPGFTPEAIPLAQRGCAASSFLNSRVWTAPSPLYSYNTSTLAANCSVTIAAPPQDGRTYDRTFVYPRIDDGCYLGRSFKTLDDFQPNSFYNYLQWSDSGSGTHKTSVQACNEVPAGERGDCQSCLNGGAPYYVSPTTATSVFRGNFLHFFGPTHIGALAAWKHTISGNAKIRWGHGNFDNTLPGITKVRDPNPECNKFDTDFSIANRSSYINSFSNNPPTFGITRFPLAQALFSVGFFLTDRNRWPGISSTMVRATNNQWLSSDGTNQDPICTPCQFSATILITTGAMNREPASTIHPDIQAMAVETPGDKSMAGKPCDVATPFSCGTSMQCVEIALGVGTCRDEFWADDVAAYFALNDLRTGICGSSSSNPSPGQSCQPDKQVMTTYVLNVGTPNNPALRSVAAAGKGFYLEAATASDIREALAVIVNDIIRRSTSFSVASVSSVQTRTLTSVFVPRFKPSVLSNWEGHLYRYSLFNEAAAGCRQGIDTVAPFTDAKKARNPNMDGSCGDVYVMDADGDFVGENSDGDFVKLNRNASYPWPETTVPAKPHWNLADKLVQDGPGRRSIYTAVDVNEDGRIAPDERIAFTVANVARLMTPLGVGSYTGLFCQDLAIRMNVEFTEDADCAKAVIRYVRGEDIFDEDGDGNTTEARALILSDIFHSSPVLVVPPLSPMLCDLGANKSQCIPAVFRAPTPDGHTAYNAFHEAHRMRDQFVLVGSNGGMLHAVQAGSWREGNALAEGEFPHFDNGTGRELWAFIPPSMLPKLKRLLMGEGHQELVDGSPMVRDVWYDANRDGKKQGDEYYTLAITGMRRGGRARFALDVTDPNDPKFLWEGPRAGSADLLDAGESWGDAAPLPPAIVPVPAEAVSPYAESFRVNGVATREQWVFLFGGGYDPNGLRGRGLYVADVRTGDLVFRYAAREAADANDLRRRLGPVAAAVGAVDWDEFQAGAEPDHLFDTASAVDLLGNVWTLRTSLPGKDTDGDGRYDNWFVARAFETNRDGTLQTKLPFFEMPQHAFANTLPPQLRVYAASGDRAFIRDEHGGVCRLNNIAGCIRKGCSVDVSMSPQTVGASTSSGRLVAAGTASAPSTFTAAASSAAPACGVAATASVTAALNCGTNGGGTLTYGLNCPGGDVPCTSRTPRPYDVAFPFAGATTWNRLYSVRVFADPVRPLFTSAAGAATYDAARLTDSNLKNPDLGEFADGFDNGYFIRYASQNERTSGGTYVSDAIPVLFWQTLTPLTDVSFCSREGVDVGSIYQAHLITGGTSYETGRNVDWKNAAVARRSTRSVLTPPKTPIPQKVITPYGEVVSIGLSIEAGEQPLAIQAGRSELFTPIQVLEVDRRMHNCRHRDPPICD